MMKMKKACIYCRPYIFGSPTWIRTRDLRINSPSLYRLSYQGIDKTGIILSLAISVKDYARTNCRYQVNK